MLKLMEASMAAGLTFTWDAKFDLLEFDRFCVHLNKGGIYDVYYKNNVWVMFSGDAGEVVECLVANR